MATLSDEELMQSADAYFARMTLASEQCRKPFGNPADAVHQTRHLGLVLDAADLFRGARVLDFGCATGWLTLGLAQMGCDAIGVDIAPNALKLAEALKARRAPAQGSGSLEFLAYDGKRLPVDGASLDRIVCFDAFHHVRDQAATLAEFARVLRPGGRAAFMEPGPNHSKTPQSQAEMARFKVIENDVDMEAVTRDAMAVGFEGPQLLLQFAQPFTVSAENFNAWARLGIPKDWASQAIGSLERQLTNGQCFYIVKGDPSTAGRDSRRAEGLAAELVLHSARAVPSDQGHGIALSLELRNTGERHWLTEGAAGQVNLGVQIFDAEGLRVIDDNFARVRLPRGTVAPGAKVAVEGIIARPTLAAFTLRLDLVAELVSWFGSLGRTRPVLLRSEDL